MATESEKRWTVSCCDKHPWSRVRFRDGALACFVCEREGVPAVPHFHNVEVVPAPILEAAKGERDEAEADCAEAIADVQSLRADLQELREGLQREIDGLRASVQAGEEELVGSTPEYEARMHEQNAIRTRLSNRLEALLPHSPDGREEGSNG
jgi:hypothetical protein